MATTTSQSDSAKGYAVKFGKNHAVSQGSVNHELQIVKSLLSELNSGITDAIDKYSDYTSTSKDNNNPNVSQYFASDFDKDNIQILLNNSESYRSHAITASYVGNPDLTVPGDSSDNVVINATTNAIVLSEVLDDSSAYANATAKITLSDPYYTNSDPLAFTDSNSKYNGYFDKNNISKFLTTRNANSNSAHSNGEGSITAAEHTSWNTRDSNFGCFFVNGTVNIDSTTGAPSAIPYGASDAANILNQSLYKYSISLNPVNPTDDPIFGRYQLTYGNSNSVNVDYNNISSTPYMDFNIKYVTDTAYDLFIANIDASTTETTLPNSIAVSGLDNWLDENTGTYANGFLFKIESTSTDALLSSATGSNDDNLSIPLDFNLNNMNFAAKNMYILQQSMITNASQGSSNLLPSLTEYGNTYNNRLVITNGGLTLEETADFNFIELLDGYENLDSTSYLSNGSISVYNSSKLSVYGDNTNFPRATGILQSSTSQILSNIVVQYSTDSSSDPSGGVLSGNDLEADISYNVTCLVGSTNTTDSSGNWNNLIGYNNGAVALVKDTNASILPSEITFHSNTTTTFDNNSNLTVIDIACNKKWSESKVYDSGNTQITGIVSDIVTTNTDSSSFNLRDIRLKMTAKVLSDLALSPSNGWGLSCPDAYLTSSTGKMGFIGDSSLEDYLLSLDSDTPLLSNIFSVKFEPTSTSIQAHKFTKFRTQILTSYVVDGITYTQITYDDEFDATISAPSFNADELINTTGFTKPSDTKLYKRSYSQNVSVKIPLRLGNYNNIFITTPTVTQTVEYYILTDDTNNNAELPRNSLKDVRTATNQPINASFTMLTSTTDITFSKNTFKTHKYSLEKKLDSSNWSDVTIAGVYHADLWYNTQTIIPSPLGTFAVTQTISPTVANMNYQYLYIDMELEKSTSSFSISGVSIAPETVSQILVNQAIDFSTFGFSSYQQGIDNLGVVTYTKDSDVAPNAQAGTTLSALGYTFKFTGEFYLSIRIITCQNGLFKSIKYSSKAETTITYPTIQTINSQPSLKLQDGIYAYGGLLSAISRVSSTTWKLNNDAISAVYFTNGSFASQRINSTVYEYRPYANWRGFKIKLLRGLTPGLTTAINRTPSKYLFQLAGYEASGNIYSGISINAFGGIQMSSNVNLHSIFPSQSSPTQAWIIGETQSWNFNATYGSYTITSKQSVDASLNTSTLNSFMFLLADRKNVNIVSTSLNTKSGFYSIVYSDVSSLTVRKNNNITATNYNDNPSGYSTVGSATFTTAELRDTTRRNLIGNILDIHFTTGDLIPDMSLCHFSICPPYFKFSAIDPSSVTTIPFISNSGQVVNRYVAVNSVNYNYTPFSGHSTINNITFNKTSSKYYLQYFSDSDSNVNSLNVQNYYIEISLANGLASNSTIGTYQTFYGPATIDASSNEKVDLSLNSTLLTVGINQQQLALLSGFTIYDASYTEYNLQMNIGSIFISDLINSYDGIRDIILEFKAGDCTKLTQYGIESIDVNSNTDSLDVTISRHTCATGISNDFLNKSSQGLSIPWTTKDTMTLSTSLNSSSELTSTTRGTNTYLNNLRSSITSLPGWNLVNSPSSTLPKMALIPHNTTGQKSLRQFLTTSKNIPLSTAILELQDHVRITDSYGVPINRITYGGALQGHVLSLNSTVIREKVGSEPSTYLVDKINSALPTTHSF